MWSGAISNEAAFLDMLAISEGTAGKGDDGYNVLVGGNLFAGYVDHPRIKVFIPRLKIYSTAAGRYQLLAQYFNVYKKMLALPDFSPDSQDRIALHQIEERGASDLVRHGHFNDAVATCAGCWASLPGSGYGQGTNSLTDLQTAFLRAGGTIA